MKEHSPSGSEDGTSVKSPDRETFYSCESPGPGHSLVDTSTPESSEEFVTSSTVTEKLVGVKLPPLIYPKSQYLPWKPPVPPANQKAAISSLAPLTPVVRYQGDVFVALDLNDFTFYRTAGGPHSHEMVPLHEVASKQGSTTFLLDGILSSGDEQRYLERVSFKHVSTGGYENVEQHSIGLDLWIQSVESRKYNIWYRLVKPSPEYAPYHDSFLWLANLAKHVVDYLSAHGHERILLLHFKRRFATWLQRHHKGVQEFDHWFSQHNSRDFRQAIVAHGDYLWKQAADIDARYGKCQVWREIGVTASIVKEQPQRESQTVITPYVFDCFKHMDWAHHLKSINLDSEVRAKQHQRLKALGFVQKAKPATLRFSAGDGLKSAPILRGKSTISCGDIIATNRDTETVWKGNHDDLWYAFVQHISQDRRNRIWLHAIWLYKPSDTVCADMTYPFDNELFMSDHCNCHDTKIEVTEVVQKVKVSFFSDGTNVRSDFFIRQSYHSEDETFATLKEKDFCCNCRRTKASQDSPATCAYAVGETVLIESVYDNDMILEPAEITDIQESGDIQIRELRRRQRDFKDPKSRPNELVYTNKFREVHVDQVERRCHVRIYTQEDVQDGMVPAPYNRDGNGDAFYITCREGEGNSDLEPIQLDSVTFKQGFDPNHNNFQRLRALNIFSGGGTFDRGLEEGGAIRNEWAVEWGMAPILTYRANHSHPERLNLFCGSVNDYLSMAIRGKGQGTEHVAQIGQPDFLSAGSPCQGYSLANPKKATEESLRNCSMVASVMGFVDLYRFKYGLLENVTSMASKSNKKNPLSQILCCLVGMGYQCR